VTKSGPPMADGSIREIAMSFIKTPTSSGRRKGSTPGPDGPRRPSPPPTQHDSRPIPPAAKNGPIGDVTQGRSPGVRRGLRRHSAGEAETSPIKYDFKKKAPAYRPGNDADADLEGGLASIHPFMGPLRPPAHPRPGRAGSRGASTPANSGRGHPGWGRSTVIGKGRPRIDRLHRRGRLPTATLRWPTSSSRGSRWHRLGTGPISRTRPKLAGGGVT